MKTRLLFVVLLLGIGAVLCTALFLPNKASTLESESSSKSGTDRTPVPSESLMTPRVEAATEDARPETPRVALEKHPTAEHTGSAFLTIHVVAREDGRPLEGAHVSVYDAEGTSHVTVTVDDTQGQLGESVHSGADGIARFAVPAHKAFLVFASGSDRTKGIRPSLSRVEVRALEPDEELMVDLALRSKPDITFFGRLVAAENGAPLGGGKAALVGHPHGVEYNPYSETSNAVPRAQPHASNEPNDASIATAVSDTLGVFELDGASWAEHFARIDVTGRSLIFVNMSEGHETAETALAIRLARTASVLASVTDGVGLPLNRVNVRITFRSNYKVWATRTSAYNPAYPAYPDWAALTDTKGECRIDDLPSDVALTLELSSGDQVDPHVDEALVLKGGEERRLDLHFGGRASMNGALVDLEEKPLADEAVWLRQADRIQRGQFDPTDKVFAKTRTDAQGRFSFDKLTAGDWWVGPAARAITLPSIEVARTLAPIAELVHVPSTGSVDVIVHTARGLSIRGHVVGPRGEPMSDASVVAAMVGTQIKLSTSSNGDGSFLLGPLVSGEYDLTARARMLLRNDYPKAESLAPCGPIRTKGGEQYAVLVLHAGGSIRCILQFDGVPDDPGQVITSVMDPDGKSVGGVLWNVPCPNLAPGSYSAFAFSTKGTCAVRAGIDVRSGETTDAILALRQGAKLRVKRGADAQGTDDEYQVLFDGVRVAAGRLESAQPLEHTVPAGHLVLRKRVGHNPWSEDALDVEAGETRDVVLRP